MNQSGNASADPCGSSVEPENEKTKKRKWGWIVLELKLRLAAACGVKQNFVQKKRRSLRRSDLPLE
jgi:hypothetical protein